jgi:hypothetical protein
MTGLWCPAKSRENEKAAEREPGGRGARLVLALLQREPAQRRGDDAREVLRGLPHSVAGEFKRILQNACHRTGASMTDQQFRAVLIHLRIIMGLLAFIVGILLAFAWEYL